MPRRIATGMLSTAEKRTAVDILLNKNFVALTLCIQTKYLFLGSNKSSMLSQIQKQHGKYAKVEIVYGNCYGG